MKHLKSTLLLIFSLLLITPTWAQLTKQYWAIEHEKSIILKEYAFIKKLPSKYTKTTLDYDAFRDKLTTESNNTSSFSIQIPTPNGDFEEFFINKNSVVAPEVAHLYTNITFQGQNSKNPATKIRCDIDDTGFHAFVYNGSNSYYIYPVHKGNNTAYIVYFKKDFETTPIKCLVNDEDQVRRSGAPMQTTSRTPTELRLFRLAYVASGEYSQQFGGNPYSTTNVLNSLSSAVNIVNGIYEKDLGVQYSLVSTAALVFPDPNTDPFDLSDQSALINQNQVECDNAIGNANYDIGHLLVWENTGGLAALGVVCFDTEKGKGFSGNDSSIPTLIIDYSCHEIGHQLEGSHNFVSQECGTSTDNYRFEPGEGSSIMSYAGVCGAPASYQSYSNQYFHSASINAMNGQIAQWGSCLSTSTPGSGNSAAPVVNAQSDITIPMQTPFILVGSATDANDGTGALTYIWEQYDNTGGAVAGPPDCSSTAHPLFKFVDATNESYRIFPNLTYILSGNNNGSSWEKLPCATRNINFNLIARDNNNNWGRTGQDAMAITVANTGPFEVLSPNGSETWEKNSAQTISWSVNGTNAHTSHVDILISYDGGVTFSSLASGVPNNGSYSLNAPSTLSSTARILIQGAVGGGFKSASTFFDISDGNFTIEEALPIELLSFSAKKNSDTEIMIQWSTSLEINNSHFEVEKSVDGHHFYVIEKVMASETPQGYNHYSVFDKNPVSGINYYRLKQIDKDGNYYYSAIKNVTWEKALNQVYIYPNPANEKITVSIPSQQKIEYIYIYNHTGQLVLKSHSQNSIISTSTLQNGMYNIFIKTNKGEFYKKLQINR